MARVRRALWLVRAWLRRRGWLAPEVLAAGPRLTTYNIGRGARVRGARADTLDRVAATIATERPDVVALQEVHEPDVPVIVAFLRDAHDLAYHHTFGEAVAAEEIARRRFRGRVGAYGIALLSREPLAEVRVERLPGTGEPRVAIVARTALAGTEVTVVVDPRRHQGPRRPARRADPSGAAPRRGRPPGRWWWRATSTRSRARWPPPWPPPARTSSGPATPTPPRSGPG